MDRAAYQGFVTLYEGNGATQNVVCNLQWENQDYAWNFQVSGFSTLGLLPVHRTQNFSKVFIKEQCCTIVGGPIGSAYSSHKMPERPTVIENCNKNPIFVYPEKELSSVPNSTFNIFVCEQFMYIFPGSLYIFSCCRIGRSMVGIYKLIIETGM